MVQSPPHFSTAVHTDSFGATKSRILEEIDCLNQNTKRLNGVMAMQQNIAAASGVCELVHLDELVEDTMRKHEEAYQQQSVQMIRDFSPAPAIRTDRYKLTRVLSDLLANAKDACVAKPDGERKVRVRLGMNGQTGAKIEVADTGLGIAAENLVRIFSPEFNSTPDGRGLGLHSGALVMKSLGGAHRSQHRARTGSDVYARTTPGQQCLPRSHT